MTTKFNSASPPSFVREGEFTTGVLAWWVTVGNDEYRLFDGDYIVQDENGVPIRYVSTSQYASDLAAQADIREYIGYDLIRAIWSALRASAMSDANKAGVSVAISPVMGMIRDGEIQAARFLANATTTTASYTSGVKSALLSIIDQAIAKL